MFSAITLATNTLCRYVRFRLRPVPYQSYRLNVPTASASSNDVPKTSYSKKTEDEDEEAATTDQEEDEYVEGVVCQESDVGENEMKTFDLGDSGKVLLVRQRGVLSAIGTKCTHYGAPLVNGALGDGRVRCQWHGACFNIVNGDIEDFPGLDSLPCYQVTIENSDVKVRAKRSHLQTHKRVKPMVRAVKPAPGGEAPPHVVVIGGGPAGATCVETLRQEGFTGAITMVCKEHHLPYDRVKVSKAMDFEIDKAQFRSDQFYRDADIDIRKGSEATAVNTTDRTVTLIDGTVLKYDKLFLGTGMKAIKANIPGADLKNVLVLRDYDHSKYTSPLLLEDTEIVVLGASFVAIEAASYCVNKVKKVTVVGRGNVPFEPLVGREVGGAYMKLCQDKGINFVMNSGMTRCIGDGDNNVSAVELLDGTELKADVVIMGVGSVPYTDFLKNSGLKLLPDGTLEVDEYLETSTEGVYAGGDIACAPVWSYNNKKSAIGHYPLAHYHGRMAAINMAAKDESAKKPMRAVPYFWTMIFGKGLRFAGHGQFVDAVYIGDVENLKYVAYYLDENDEVIGASSTGMDPVVSQFAEMLAQGKKLYRKDVEGDETFGWTKKLFS